MQTSIPFLFMRGGSSRGPFFQRKDLPADRDKLSEVLVAALGSGHPLNIDGIGGGNATKVIRIVDDRHEKIRRGEHRSILIEDDSRRIVSRLMPYQ